MSPGSGPRQRPDTALPPSHRARVSQWSVLFRGGATTTWPSLAESLPELDQSRLTFRAADHGENFRCLLLECLPIISFDVQAQQGLRIGGSDVEPPGWKAHGHAIEMVDFGAFSTISLLDRSYNSRRVLDFRVDLAGPKTVVQRRDHR